MKTACFLFLFFLSIISVNILHAQKSNHAIITIQIQGAQEGDSIQAIQNSFNLHTPETQNANWLTIHNKEISIVFNAMNHPGYFKLYDRKRKNLMGNEYLVEPGDSVYIIINGDNIAYSGKGHHKWKCLREMELSQKKIASKFLTPGSFHSGNQRYDYCDSVVNDALHILNTYRHKISDQAFHLMQADIIGSDLIFRVEISGFDFYPKADPSQRSRLDSLYWRLNRHMKKTAILNHQPVTAYSFYWPYSILKKCIVDSFLMLSRPFDLTTQLRYIFGRYEGKLRDHLVASLVHNFNRGSDCLVPCLKEALAVVRDPELSELLEKQYLHYLQGADAFNFSLRDTSGKILRLTDFAGKTIVMDFWYTGCFNCIEASTALQSSIEPLFKRDTNLVFLSVSVDRDKNTWMQSLRRWIYSTPDRINLYTDQRGESDPLIKYYNIFGYPTLMMIDKNGKLYSARLPDPRAKNGQALINVIKDAIAL